MSGFAAKFYEYCADPGPLAPGFLKLRLNRRKLLAVHRRPS
jgi:hypothetical protein